MFTKEQIEYARKIAAEEDAKEQATLDKLKEWHDSPEYKKIFKRDSDGKAA